MKDAIPNATAVVMAIIGLAILAIILSGQSKTSSVISSIGSNFARTLRCAMGPIIGSTGDCGTSVSSTLSFPSVNIGG